MQLPQWTSRVVVPMLFKPIATVSPVAFEPETIKLMGESFGCARKQGSGTRPRVSIQEYVANRLEPPTGANVT